MVGMVIHIGDGEFCITYVTDQDIEAIEVFDIAWVTMSNTVFMETIGQRARLDWAAFLLAVATDHKKVNMVDTLDSMLLGETFAR